MKCWRELKGKNEHTCNKLRPRRFFDFGRDRERGSKPVSRYEEWIIYTLTALYGGMHWYTQDLNAALS